MGEAYGGVAGARADNRARMEAASPKPALLGLTGEDLARALRDAAPERFRAGQIARWMYERRASDFSEMTDLPKPLREELASRFEIGLPRIVARTPAEDRSEKLLFELADGARVEAVHIRDGERVTICVSSQAGCAVDCVFCVTGRMGAGRNLTAGEIAGQYLAIAKLHGFGPHVANVVFMGMGEPLLNLPGLFGALDVLEREVAPRRITVSTSGIVPGIDALASRPRRPNLAVSLSAADDETRTRLMPINEKYPLAELFASLKRWPLEKGRRITFEYVLIAGVNDDLLTARRLARLAARVPSKVNLIPLNESREWLPDLKRPKEEVVDAFARELLAAGTAVTVRWSKGLGANAACGQLKGRESPRRAARPR
jgi:23S rRNA (adenine2503-C2)-methyltransferase